MNSVTKKSALKVLALTTFATIGLQGTAFAIEAKPLHLLQALITQSSRTRKKPNR
ncbi:hypothetical protein WDV92_03635 [Pseudomonas syringae pv. atrofaciens]